jgi:hypothetical protein
MTASISSRECSVDQLLVSLRVVTQVNALGSSAFLRLRYMTSERNGMTGAISLLSVTSTVYSVW